MRKKKCPLSLIITTVTRYNLTILVALVTIALLLIGIIIVLLWLRGGFQGSRLCRRQRPPD